MEDKGSFRASRSIPNGDAADIAAKRQAWDRACRDWSRDNCTDILKTMGLGEAVMFAATDLIGALEKA